MMVTTEVSGTTPVGSTFRLSRALISVLLPRLNSPSTTRLNRSSATLVRAAARCRRGVSARRPVAERQQLIEYAQPLLSLVQL